MRSMTGYGRGIAEADGMRIAAEIRAVNHRFLDLKLRTAGLDPETETAITAAVRARLERGAVTVSIRISQGGAAAAPVVNVAAARQVYDSLCELAVSLGGRREDVTMALVCAQPGVMVASEGDEIDKVQAAGRRAITAAVNQALDALVEMRTREGHTLESDLQARLGRVSTAVDTIEGHAALAPELMQARLRERLDRLLADGRIALSEDRLGQEVALLCDRIDITEELVRLRGHVTHADKLMSQSQGAVGRRLEFLVQEMGREINTVGAKSQSAEIARCVVEVKGELEKIREQVQNLE